MITEPTRPTDKPTDQEQTMLRDYEAALRTVRAARGVFLLLLIVALLVHVAAFCLVRWGDVLHVAKAAEDELRAPIDENAGEGNPMESAEAAQTSSFVGGLIEVLLPLMEFIGQISCALLAFCFLVSAIICLCGGLGGVRGSLSAFFWMLVLLALLFPWERWLAGTQVPGVFITFHELDRLPAEFQSRLAEVLFYVRYLGYPVLALLILLVGNGRYARGYRLVRRHLENRLRVRAI